MAVYCKRLIFQFHKVDELFNKSSNKDDTQYITINKMFSHKFFLKKSILHYVSEVADSKSYAAFALCIKEF